MSTFLYLLLGLACFALMFGLTSATARTEQKP